MRSVGAAWCRWHSCAAGSTDPRRSAQRPAGSSSSRTTAGTRRCSASASFRCGPPSRRSTSLTASRSQVERMSSPAASSHRTSRAGSSGSWRERSTRPPSLRSRTVCAPSSRSRSCSGPRRARRPRWGTRRATPHGARSTGRDRRSTASASGASSSAPTPGTPFRGWRPSCGRPRRSRVTATSSPRCRVEPPAPAARTLRPSSCAPSSFSAATGRSLTRRPCTTWSRSRAVSR